MNKLDAVISLDNHIMRMYTMAWGISDKDLLHISKMLSITSMKKFLIIAKLILN